MNTPPESELSSNWSKIRMPPTFMPAVLPTLICVVPGA
jgi:hypothetical protein